MRLKVFPQFRLKEYVLRPIAEDDLSPLDDALEARIGLLDHGSVGGKWLAAAAIKTRTGWGCKSEGGGGDTAVALPTCGLCPQMSLLRWYSGCAPRGPPFTDAPAAGC